MYYYIPITPSVPLFIFTIINISEILIIVTITPSGGTDCGDIPTNFCYCGDIPTDLSDCGDTPTDFIIGSCDCWDIPYIMVVRVFNNVT